MSRNSSLHHRVFAHEHLSSAAHTNTNVLKLLRGHVISIADEDFVVLSEKPVDFLEVGGLPF